MPGDRDFDHAEIGSLLHKYLAIAPGVTVDNRRRILRLIENMTMGRNAVGYLVESLHGAGSPEAQRIMINRLMDLNDKKSLARRLAGIEPYPGLEQLNVPVSTTPTVPAGGKQEQPPPTAAAGAAAIDIEDLHRYPWVLPL
eukprot:g2648.t1